MFTGIIEEIGKMVNISGSDPLLIEVACKKILKDTVVGESIAVNGTCLTVTDISDNRISFNIMKETTKTINMFAKNDEVNLERAATPNSRLGGHLVSGHVDTIGIINKVKQEKNSYQIEIGTDKKFMKYIIDKGSVALDGISLTVQKKLTNSFVVGIIPHTLENTILKNKAKNNKVNIEFDQIAKYVDNMQNKDTGVESSKRLKRFLRS